MPGTRDAVASHRWFYRAFNFQEKSFEKTKECFEVKDDKLLCKATGEEHHVGPWETPSVMDLRARLEATTRKPDPDNGLTFRNVVAGTAALHHNEDNAGAVFQVAALYNCLHTSEPSQGPEEGITGYSATATQGPAGAMSCPAALVYRNFFLNAPGAPKLDLLTGVAQAVQNGKEGYWTMRNGYLLPKPPAKIDALSARLGTDKVLGYDVEENVRVGVHWDTEVGGYKHRVCQVCCSCAPIGFTKQVKAADWEKFASLLLDGAYDATLTVAALLAAQRKERVKVFLTVLGGGALSNRMRWIIRAMDKILTRHAAEPLDVMLVHYGTTNRAFLALQEDRPQPQPKAARSITSEVGAIWREHFEQVEPDAMARSLKSTSRKSSDAENISKSFAYFDQNGDGVIDRAEFARVLQSLDGNLFTDVTINLLLSQADADGDGEVHYDEFVAWLCGVGTEDTMISDRIIGGAGGLTIDG